MSSSRSCWLPAVYPKLHQLTAQPTSTRIVSQAYWELSAVSQRKPMSKPVHFSAFCGSLPCTMKRFRAEHPRGAQFRIRKNAADGSGVGGVGCFPNLGLHRVLAKDSEALRPAWASQNGPKAKWQLATCQVRHFEKRQRTKSPFQHQGPVDYLASTRGVQILERTAVATDGGCCSSHRKVFTCKP